MSAVKFSSVKPPGSSEPGTYARRLYCITAASAATKPSAHKAAGDTRTRKNGLEVMTPRPDGTVRTRRCAVRPSVDDVLCEPFAPLRGLLRAQLVVDDDRLLVPLVGRGEHARQLGDVRIDFRVEDHRAALLELGDFGLYLRIEGDVDEFIGEIRLLGAFHDGDGVDAEDCAFLRNHQLDRHALTSHIVRVHR